MLISFAVTAKLICVFVFAYAKSRFSHDAAHFQAIKRMGERNKLTEEQAKQRLESQLSNQERVQRSNVILSSLWEPEYTQSQVSVE